jgi:hypothetical protein
MPADTVRPSVNGLTQDDQIDLKYVPRSPKIFADASDTDSHYKASLPPDETHQGRFARQIVNAEDATESSKGRPRANCQTIVGDSGEVSSRFSGKQLPYHENRLTYSETSTRYQRCIILFRTCLQACGRSSKLSQCEADHADLDHCHAGFGIRCVLFRMVSAAGQPCERPSSNPPFGKRHELLHAHRSMGGRLIFVGLGTKRRAICHCPSVGSLGSCFSDMATAPCASFLNK